MKVTATISVLQISHWYYPNPVMCDALPTFLFYFRRMNRVFELHELDEVATSLLNTFPENRIFAFHAPMGSGKTTFIAALCKQLGVSDHPASPTFSIINEYALTQSLSVYHMDWYRLKHTEDAIEAGVQDILEMQDVYIFIEWPEMAAELLQGLAVLHVQLEFVDELKRRIVTE